MSGVCTADEQTGLADLLECNCECCNVSRPVGLARCSSCRRGSRAGQTLGCGLPSTSSSLARSIVTAACLEGPMRCRPGAAGSGARSSERSITPRLGRLVWREGRSQSFSAVTGFSRLGAGPSLSSSRGCVTELVANRAPKRFVATVPSSGTQPPSKLVHQTSAPLGQPCTFFACQAAKNSSSVTGPRDVYDSSA